MDRGSWWAILHGVTKSQTQLSMHILLLCSNICLTKSKKKRKKNIEEENKYKLKERNKALLYNTGNYAQYPVLNHNGKEYEKEYI